MRTELGDTHVLWFLDYLLLVSVPKKPRPEAKTVLNRATHIIDLLLEGLSDGVVGNCFDAFSTECDNGFLRETSFPEVRCPLA